jgi:hypothetical protein
MLGVFCQLLQLSKSFGPGYLPERSAPGETFENLRTEIKNPASSAGPIRLQTSTSGFARCSTEYYPVFVTGLTPSPERARLNRDRPLTLSTSRTAWEYNSFSRSVKRPLKFAEFRSVGISDLVEIRCRGDFLRFKKFKETHGKNETAECDCARPSRFIDKRLVALIRFTLLPQQDRLEQDRRARRHSRSTCRPLAPLAWIRPRPREPVALIWTARG